MVILEIDFQDFATAVDANENVGCILVNAQSIKEFLVKVSEVLQVDQSGSID